MTPRASKPKAEKAPKAPKPEAEKAPPQSDGLFTWMDALWSKATPPAGTPPTYMLHRFLAYDPDFAQAAHVLQREVREPDLVYQTWRGLLPRARSAPRFGYVAAKKPPAAELLITRIMTVRRERREAAETMVDLMTVLGKLPELYREFGVEVPKEK